MPGATEGLPRLVSLRIPRRATGAPMQGGGHRAGRNPGRGKGVQCETDPHNPLAASALALALAASAAVSLPAAPRQPRRTRLPLQRQDGGSLAHGVVWFCRGHFDLSSLFSLSSWALMTASGTTAGALPPGRLGLLKV